MTRWLLASCVALVLSMGATASGDADVAKSIVIVLSWDGTRHDYPERADTPALDRMAREGARARRLTPVFPASTFPNHVSLATGAFVERHGIVANSFRDRSGRRFHYSDDASWIQAEPLWAAAERQEVRAATFFWVGSETDWRGVGATHRRAPFDEKVPDSEKVDQILAWLDLPVPERPRLIMSWWHGCDHVGHRRGPEHAEVAAQLVRQDALLGLLLDGLDARRVWAHTTLFVVSDHGMTPVGESVDAAGPLEREAIEAEFVFAGGAAFIFLERPEQSEAALRALNAVDALRAYPSDRLPDGLAAYFPERSGDVVVITDPPHTVYRPRGWARLRPASRGGHGYHPDHPDMGAIFFALGRGVAPDLELDAVRAVDLSPTVAGLLGIDPPADAQGRPISGIRAR